LEKVRYQVCKFVI